MWVSVHSWGLGGVCICTIYPCVSKPDWVHVSIQVTPGGPCPKLGRSPGVACRATRLCSCHQAVPSEAEAERCGETERS